MPRDRRACECLAKYLLCACGGPPAKLAVTVHWCFYQNVAVRTIGVHAVNVPQTKTEFCRIVQFQTYVHI